MSILTVDRATYNTILNDTIKRYQKQGYAFWQALHFAQELMSNAFRSDDPLRDDDLDARDSHLDLTD